MCDRLFCFIPNRSLDFMTEWYLFREDCWRNQRRRSGLRRDGFVDKIPEEMPLCHEKDKKDDDLCAFRSNDRFGFMVTLSQIEQYFEVFVVH